MKHLIFISLIALVACKDPAKTEMNPNGGRIVLCQRTQIKLNDSFTVKDGFYTKSKFKAVWMGHSYIKGSLPDGKIVEFSCNDVKLVK